VFKYAEQCLKKYINYSDVFSSGSASKAPKASNPNAPYAIIMEASKLSCVQCIQQLAPMSLAQSHVVAYLGF